MTNDMIEGAFALIDCLGWKNIWRRTSADGKQISPQAIIDKVRTIKNLSSKSTENYLKGLYSLNIKVRPKLLFLSDTIVVGIPPIKHPDPILTPEIKRALSVEMACLIISDILDQFVEDEPYLTIRGCLTYGEFLIKDNVILGPAVDEAANNYELAQGAFVWLRPQAAEKLGYLTEWRETNAIDSMKKAEACGLDERSINVLQSYIDTTKNPPFVISEYNVPIKALGNYFCPVINPLFFIEESQQRALTLARYESTFDGDSLDILVKKQNTMDFLSVASDRTLSYYETMFDRGALEEIFSHLLPVPKVNPYKKPLHSD